MRTRKWQDAETIIELKSCNQLERLRAVSLAAIGYFARSSPEMATNFIIPVPAPGAINCRNFRRFVDVVPDGYDAGIQSAVAGLSEAGLYPGETWNHRPKPPSP